MTLTAERLRTLPLWAIRNQGTKHTAVGPGWKDRWQGIERIILVYYEPKALVDNLGDTLD
jgi:hypothetical protein